MRESIQQWSVVGIGDTPLAKPYQLKPGRTTIGRSRSNDIRLPDKSVSREHAVLEFGEEGLTITDLESVNGVLVNSVPRGSAHLQPDDILTIGDFQFTVSPSTGTTPSKRQKMAAVSKTVNAMKTVPKDTPLPVLKGERRLSAIYFISAWLAEDMEEQQVIEKALPILRQALKASQVHFYNERQDLISYSLDANSEKPMKIAGFLSDQFQAAPEAITFDGQDIKYHQKGFGNFNYLVCPLKPNSRIKGETPYIVLIKPGDWQQFDSQDRVLIQAITQIWSRTTARIQRIQHLSKENQLLNTHASVEQPVMLGDSPAMEKLRSRIEKSAANDAPLMIVGETGTGKEVAAWMIHQNSNRKDKPFVKLNCAAIPEGLIESELFGHNKGAFTDARRDRLGKFEQADGGTLFLDEIGEMPLSVQSKVLRAIETSEFERVGSEGSTKVDIRIVTATHRNLKEMVEKETFRQDLLFRLDVLRIKTPALRDHLEDIEVLADHFLRLCSEKNGVSYPSLQKGAIDALMKHDWPGNVRELRNVMQRAALLTNSPEITGEFMEEILDDLEDDQDW